MRVDTSEMIFLCVYHHASVSNTHARVSDTCANVSNTHASVSHTHARVSNTSVRVQVDTSEMTLIKPICNDAGAFSFVCKCV